MIIDKGNKWWFFSCIHSLFGKNHARNFWECVIDKVNGLAKFMRWFLRTCIFQWIASFLKWPKLFEIHFFSRSFTNIDWKPIIQLVRILRSSRSKNTKFTKKSFDREIKAEVLKDSFQFYSTFSNIFITVRDLFQSCGHALKLIFSLIYDWNGNWISRMQSQQVSNLAAYFVRWTFVCNVW